MTDLIQKQSTELVQPNNDFYGAAEDVTAQDMVFPLLAINQLQTGRVATGSIPGTFYHYGLQKDITKKNDPLYFVPLKYFKYFELLNAKENNKSISMEPWTINHKVNRDRNDGIKESETFIYYMFTEACFKSESFLPVKYIFRISGTYSAKMINTTLGINRQGGIRPWDFYFKMGTLFVDEKSKKYFRPVISFSKEKPVEAAYKHKAEEWARVFSGKEFNKTIEKDIALTKEDVAVEPTISGGIFTDF